MIIYVCIRVRNETGYLDYESAIVRGSVLDECGMYVYMCQIACMFAYRVSVQKPVG
jgi:hypothetical protein